MKISAVGNSGDEATGDPLSTVDDAINQLYMQFSLNELRSIDSRVRQLADGAMGTKDFERMYKLCVLYAQHAALPGDGLPVANKWARCARARGALPHLRKALTVRASLRCMSGDLGGAMEDNIEAYEISVELGDLTSSAVVLCNLANLLIRLEIDRSSLRLAERAIKIVSSEVPTSDVAIQTRCISLSVIADRLLWSDPGRALRISLEAERYLPEETALALIDPVQKEIFQLIRITTLCNQLVAALNMRDRALAVDVGARLRRSAESSSKNYSRSAAFVILGALEAWYGDQDSGINTLREASLQDASGGVWQDATKLLVDLCEERGLEEEGLKVLRGYYARLQAARRTVAIEELRRLSVASVTDDAGDAEDDPIGRRLAAFQVSVAGMNERLTAKLEHLEGIALAAEVREGAEMNRAEHIYRVGQLCSELAAVCECTRETQWLAEISGRLHDIGKCAVPDTVLLSVEPLSGPVREIVRDHADYGARLVADADEPRLVQAVAAVRHHHERFDGSGYPSGLKGEEIPFLARIVALAESFDAMLQSRPYRSSRTVNKSLEEVERCAGTQFDPALAGTFVRLVRRIQRDHGDVLDYLGNQARTNPRVRTFERLERLMANTRSTL